MATMLLLSRIPLPAASSLTDFTSNIPVIVLRGERSIFCAIPAETQCLDTGFSFNGKGKVWIDMQSLRYDIIDDTPSPPDK